MKGDCLIEMSLIDIILVLKLSIASKMRAGTHMVKAFGITICVPPKGNFDS